MEVYGFVGWVCSAVAFGELITQGNVLMWNLRGSGPHLHASKGVWRLPALHSCRGALS